MCLRAAEISVMPRGTLRPRTNCNPRHSLALPLLHGSSHSVGQLLVLRLLLHAAATRQRFWVTELCAEGTALGRRVLLLPPAAHATVGHPVQHPVQ